MKKKNILYINIKYNQGGASKIANYLFKRFQENFNCTFLYGYGKNIEPENIEEPQLNKVKMLGSKCIVIINFIWFKLFAKNFITSKNKLLKSYIDNADIIHIHAIHGSFIEEISFLEYLIKKNKKIIWTFHDSWVLTGRCALPYDCKKYLKSCDICPITSNYPSTYLAHIEHFFKKKRDLLNSIQKNNLIIVSPSLWLYNEIEKTPLNKFKCIVINNGIDINKFFYKKKTLTPKLNILFIANYLDKSKGINLFLEIVKKFPNIDFTVVGHLSHDISNFSNLKNIGYIKNTEEIVKIYQNSNLTLFLSTIDNYPTVILESLSCGTPVISFKGLGNKEIFKNYHYPYLVDNFDFERIYEIIASINNDPNEYYKTSELGRQIIINHNSLELMYNNYLNTYKLYL